MRTIESIKENEVIHCPTEEQAIAFCKLVHTKHPNLWASVYKYYPKEICFDINNKGYADRKHFQDIGCKITDVSEFLPNSIGSSTIELQEMQKILQNSWKIIADLADIQYRIDQDHYLKGQKITLTDKTE